MSAVAAPYLLDDSQDAYVATCVQCGRTVGFVAREFLARHRAKAPFAVLHECEATAGRYQNGKATLITQHEREQQEYTEA